MTIVDRMADGREFEAMSTLASHVPVTIVADMVGLKGVSHKQLTQWASAIFDAFGPADRARTAAALPAIQDFVGHGMQLTHDDVVPGGWADSLFLAAESGEITVQTARNLVFDYALPSLDTTILATGELLYRMATEPGAFEAVRSRPALIPGVVNECVRLASPLRGFTRYCTQDFALSKARYPPGPGSGCSMLRPTATSATIPIPIASISSAIRVITWVGGTAFIRVSAFTWRAWNWRSSWRHWPRECSRSKRARPRAWSTTRRKATRRCR